MWTVNKYTCPFLLCSHQRIKFCCTRQVGVLAWCIVLLSFFERNVQLQWSVVLPTILIWCEQKPRRAVLRKARLLTYFISYHAVYQVYLFSVSGRQSAARANRCSPSDWAFPALFYPCRNVCWTVKQRGEDPIVYCTSCRRGSWILKWGVNFLHLNQRNQRNQILFQYLRNKKNGAQKKGGWKFTHFTSPGSALELSHISLHVLISFCNIISSRHEQPTDANDNWKYTITCYESGLDLQANFLNENSNKTVSKAR